jgi:hypothetical protein
MEILPLTYTAASTLNDGFGGFTNILRQILDAIGCIMSFFRAC